jgi:predicted ATPase
MAVKAFTGIITALTAGDPHVVLIDEPEAFLHPSLASMLGVEVSRAAVSSDKRVFVSTHSPFFVMVASSPELL